MEMSLRPAYRIPPNVDHKVYFQDFFETNRPTLDQLREVRDELILASVDVEKDQKEGGINNRQAQLAEGVLAQALKRVEEIYGPVPEKTQL
jgi:hypothetical protein